MAYLGNLPGLIPVDDTPVNGNTYSAASSNWAYDHDVSTVEHGASGAVVGTTNTQTLTNKTLSTGTVLSATLNCSNNHIDNSKTVTFNGEYDNGTKSSGWTLDLNNGQYQKVTISANCTMSITAPQGPGTFRLKIIQSGASRVLTLPTGYWKGGEAGANSQGDTDIDLLSIYYDGSSYFFEYGNDWVSV